MRFETADGLLDGYKHIQNDRGTIGVLVELGGVDPANAKAREVAHDIALHIAERGARATSRRDDVPADVLEQRARAVIEETSRNEGKPESASSKIVEGRLNGFYKDNVLARAGVREGPEGHDRQAGRGPRRRRQGRAVRPGQGRRGVASEPMTASDRPRASTAEWC